MCLRGDLTTFMSKDKPVSRNKTTKSLDFREAIMTRSKLAQELGWNPLADTDERRELSSKFPRMVVGIPSTTVYDHRTKWLPNGSTGRASSR
jgi:hypothetical protein